MSTHPYALRWWRWPVVAALSATAAVHITLVPGHLREAPYAGALFIALSASALGIAVLLAVSNHPVAWLTAGALSLSALLAYLASRSIGLPSMADDVGDWLNPLGVAAVGAEAIAALTCWRVLSRTSRLSHPSARATGRN